MALANIFCVVFIAPHILIVQLSLIHHPDSVTGTVFYKLLLSEKIVR